jgi:hypothetical protein
MRIRYENTIDDMAELTRYHLNHLSGYRVFFALLLSLPAAFFLAAGVLGLVIQNDLGCLAVGVAFGVVWPVLFWFLLRWLPVLNIHLLMRAGKNPGIVGWHELELADGILIERTDVGGTTAALRTVQKIASDDARTYIYLTSITAHVIPRRSVPEKEYRDFIDTLRREWEQVRQR